MYAAHHPQADALNADSIQNLKNACRFRAVKIPLQSGTP
jgi:hypothetical protein